MADSLNFFSWYVLSSLWDDAYKKNLYSERVAHVVVADLFSNYLSGPLPYI